MLFQNSCVEPCGITARVNDFVWDVCSCRAHATTRRIAAAMLFIAAEYRREAQRDEAAGLHPMRGLRPCESCRLPAALKSLRSGALEIYTRMDTNNRTPDSPCTMQSPRACWIL